MFSYLKDVIADASSGSPSTKRWVLVVSTISLCLGFLFATGALIVGQPISDTIILGLAGILAGLSGTSYVATKNKEIELKKEQRDESI